LQIATVNKWGNVQGIRLPSALCKKLGISVGDKFIIEIENGKIVLSAGKQNMPYDIKERIKFWDGKRDASKEIDMGHPVGKEIWWEGDVNV